MKTILRSKELRNKILIIAGLMLLVRLGSIIPIPGVNASYMDSILASTPLTFLNMMMGNSLSRMSFFALSITPYITASIIVQLLTVVFESLEEMRKEGKTGQEKIERITMGIGIGLAFVESFCMAVGFGAQGLLNPYTWWMVIIMTLIWTAGAAVLMLIGNYITKLELGNGISYILVCNILSTFPADLYTLYAVLVYGKTVPYQIVTVAIIAAVIFAVIAACVLLSVSERNIPMTFSGKMSGLKQQQNLPIPLNVCGVIPVIFTSSIMSLPVLASSFAPGVGWLSEISKYLSTSCWFMPGAFRYTLGMFVYIALTYAFTYFYLDVNYNTVEMANNLKKQGAVIPGIRPGKPTADYLQRISRRMAVLGTSLMLLLILITTAVCNLSGVGTLSIGGTSILICVAVIIETSKVFKTAIQSASSRAYYTQKGGEPVSIFGLKNYERAH